MRATIVGILSLGALLTVVSFLYTEPANANEWRLALCYGKQATEIDKKYRNAIAQAAQNGLSAFDQRATLQLKVRDCIEEPDLACYADNEAIFCREEPLAKLLRISAWLVAESAFIYSKYQGAPVALEQAPTLTWVDALRMADAESDAGNKRFTQYGEAIMEKRSLSAEGLNAIYALVNDLYYYTNNNEDPGTDNQVLLTALGMYKEVNQLMYSFILGHEAYHFYGNKCPITEKLAIETTGIWKEIYSLQLKNGLFSPAITLDKHELGGDLCGYRWLAAAASDAKYVRDKVLSAMAKRVAIDALASPLFVGLLTKFDNKTYGRDVPVQKNVDGYLYPPSRLILAALVLAGEEDNYPEVVRLCNDTALATVTSIQKEVSSYSKSSGYVPDSLLAALPAGVEVAWNDGNWTEGSVACKLRNR